LRGYRVRVKNAAILHYELQSRSFKLSCLRGYGEDAKRVAGLTLSPSDPLLECLLRERTALDLEQLKEQAAKGKKADLAQSPLLRKRMEELKASCLVPSFLGKDLKNVLVLGGKKSDELYTETDLNVLFTLAQESAIAIENAELYDEVLKRSRELETINQELNQAQLGLVSALRETEASNERLNETNRKLNETNESLKKLQAELMEAKKRALLAGISSAVGHELNNPLQPMLFQKRYLREDLKTVDKLYFGSLAGKMTEPERKEFLSCFKDLNERLELIFDKSERLKGIASTVVNLVKERTGTKKQVQLKLVIDTAVEEVRFSSYWERLSPPVVTKEIEKELPFINGITQDLRGIFVNLILNSLHAMEEKLDKEITIKAEQDKQDPKMIKIEFSDNGSGIPESLQEKIFQHGFTTKGERGSGIGLFYCKDNIERVPSNQLLYSGLISLN